MKFIALGLSFAFMGFSTCAKRTPITGPTESVALGPTIVSVDTKSKEVIEKLNQQASNAAASVSLIRDTNRSQPPSGFTEFIDAESVHILSYLPSPAPNRLQESTARRTAILEGQRDLARQLYTSAATEAEKARTELHDATKQLADAFKELNSLELRRQKEAEANLRQVKALEAEVERIKKEKDSAMERWTGRIFVIAGVVGFGFVGAILFFSTSSPLGLIGGINKTWAIALLSACSIGLGQLVSQSWFKYALGGFSVLAIIATALFFIFEHRSNLAAKGKAEALKLALATQEQAAKAYEETLMHVVPVIDKLEDDVKTKILPELSSKMDKAQKQIIKQVRAKL